jgi:hypothetical protein
MSGIPPALHQQIRTILLECGPFDDNSQIRDLFADARISPWRFSLPSRDNVIARVEAFIAFMAGKHRADDGQNALVLLLLVLSERLDEGSDCPHRLTAVANDLAAALGGTRPATTTTTPRRVSTDPFTNYETGLRQLEAATKNDPDTQQELSPFAQRLRENINRSRRYGDTSDRRAERAEIMDSLNLIARAVTQKSFDQWCNVA